MANGTRRRSLWGRRASTSMLARTAATSQVEQWARAHTRPHSTSVTSLDEAWISYLDWLKHRLKEALRTRSGEGSTAPKRRWAAERARMTVVVIERAMNRQLFEELMTRRFGELRNGGYQHLMLWGPEPSTHGPAYQAATRRSRKR
ncbi:hypothetical protein [Paramicrobacterium fandaimingii]|uniref:hypothetical protein n=1 Tax=Paramicrobacterium fandaimingii TaxID=2708079 RepID=UPI0014232059|nr:hypothetical protein [Microbacterium fandaimingii]